MKGREVDNEGMPIPPPEIRRAMLDSLIAQAAGNAAVTLPPGAVNQIRERAIHRLREFELLQMCSCGATLVDPHLISLCMVQPMLIHSA